VVGVVQALLCLVGVDVPGVQYFLVKN
jgi:hypothetical protein